MYSIAVCDDNQNELKNILALLDAYQTGQSDIKLCREYFTSGNELVAALDSGTVFNMYLLDILMSEQDGIELARKIRSRDVETPLVFLTTSPDYAFSAFGVSATQYILKPVGSDELFPVLDKAIDAVKMEDERNLMLSTADRIVKIPFSSIICVELSSRSLRVYLTDGSVFTSKTIRGTFEDEVAPLLSDGDFICPHKSFVVNMMWVEELKKSIFTMKRGIKVPIPRYRYAGAKAGYFAWLSGRGIRKMGGIKHEI